MMAIKYDLDSQPVALALAGAAAPAVSVKSFPIKSDIQCEVKCDANIDHLSGARKVGEEAEMRSALEMCAKVGK